MAEDGAFGRQVLQRLQDAGYKAESNEGNVRHLGQRMEWGGLEPSDRRILDRQTCKVDTCSEMVSIAAFRALATSSGRRPVSA